MKRAGIYIIVCLLFLTAFTEILLAIDDYISPATIPPSSRQSGLLRSPDPIDNSSNLLVTGNVGRGQYFRGVVPYSAPTYFGETLPSSSLDSFLRDSAGPEDFGRYTTGYKPYYSPTQTVTTTTPGTSVVVGPSTTNIGSFTAQSYPYFTGVSTTRRDAMLDPAYAISSARLRPMSMTREEMEELISSEIVDYSPEKLTEQEYQDQPEIADYSSEKLTDRQYQNREEQFRRDLNQLSDKSTELAKSLTGLDNSLSSTAVKTLDSNLPAANRLLETPPQKMQQSEKMAETTFALPEELDLDKQLDVYDSMKQQLDSLQQQLDLAMTEPQALGEAGQSQVDYSAKGETAEQQTQQLSQAEKLAQTNLSVARTKAILGPYETFASFSKNKFNQNMRAAELYLKQGKYYRAADAYTLASLYKPDDPLAYAGKSHALFAAGEYMSSALFLSRALQIFPDYAGLKVDIVAMVGDRDMLETRVVELEEWLSKSGAPELQFLLAYVYHQMDRPREAGEAINAAYKKMPQVPAVLALKKAIEDSPPADENSSQRITDDTKPSLGW